MLGIRYGTLLIVWSCFLCFSGNQAATGINQTNTNGTGSDGRVRFDAPAMVAAYDLNASSFDEGIVFLDSSRESTEKYSPGRPGKEGDAVSESTPAMKKIGIIVPLTAELNVESGVSVNSLRFDIFWNKNPFPLCDYSPKTITAATVAGTVAVERFEEKNQDLGGQLNGVYPPLLTGFIRANQGDRQGEKTRFEDIPQHNPFVSSGPIRRGTGAYFRFHPSRTEILEGGREVRLSFYVPANWRGGILQVECTASGVRKKFSWQEVEWEQQRVFIVPVYLANDEQAWQQAMNFVQTEQELRSQWRSYQQLAAKQFGLPKGGLWGEAPLIGMSTNHTTFFKPLPMTISLNSAGTEPSPLANLPNDWMHVLIQHNDKPLETYRKRLPGELESAAVAFVKSRTGLLQLSR